MKERHFSLGVWQLVGCLDSSECLHTRKHKSSGNWIQWIKRRHEVGKRDVRAQEEEEGGVGDG